MDINTYERERAQAADPDGLATYEEYINKNGWDSAVNSILVSGKYIANFGDDTVLGGIV